MLPNDIHVPNKRVDLTQNEWFASKNAFDHHLHSRRDDIIQAVYTLVFLRTGYHPIL